MIMDVQPLAPDLYHRLEEVFGEVKIANHGEESVLSYAPELLIGVRPLFSQQRPKQDDIRLHHRGGEWYRISCPYCGDSRHRLYISYRFGEEPHAVKCWNETDCMKSSINRLELRRILFGSAGPVTQTILPGHKPEPGPKKFKEPGVITLLGDLPVNHPVRQYVQQRGFDPVEIGRLYGAGHCSSVHDDKHRPLEGRLYVPIWQDGKLAGWLGRYPAELDWKNVTTSKYYNCPNMVSGNVLYNYDWASQFEDVVVVEGVTDAWSFGPQALSLLMCKLTAAKRLRLLEWRNRGAVAVCLDGEAREETKQVVESLLAMFGGKVFPVWLPEGFDPGMCPTDWLWGQVDRFAKEAGVPFRRVA
jgi:hypothetical protein